MRVSPTPPPRSGLCLGPVYSDLSRLLTDVLFEAVQWVAIFFCCRGYLCDLETSENVIRYDTGIGEAVKLPSFIARSLSCRLIRCRLIWCCPKKSGKKSAPFGRTPPFFFSKPSVRRQKYSVSSQKHGVNMSESYREPGHRRVTFNILSENTIAPDCLLIMFPMKITIWLGRVP